MFPYPSGTLHIGHLRNYTISDVIARYRRMAGFNVLHPIGWDAFGLPAENAAIERGIDPAEWTRSNIATMKTQIHSMGGCWDWDKEIMTCDPHFYKHTQQIFLLLHKHGLAYQREALVNWDPVDKTVLANEQVDSDGNSWRSGAKVEKINLNQWFFDITSYAEDLLTNLQTLEKDDAWPNKVTAMQRNWIGKSAGAKFRFQLESHSAHISSDYAVDVFTTRPDTLWGVQYLALSLDHPLVCGLAETDSGLQAFKDSASTLPPDTKAGYLLTSLRAYNPICLVANDPGIVGQLPVFAAPYVRSDYASGSVMGVPAHDSRDFQFWKDNGPELSEPIQVICEPTELPSEFVQDPLNHPFTNLGILTTHCQQYTGLSSIEAGSRIISDIQRVDPDAASHKVSWRLRDWLISRQRYWGTPIPIVHCNNCGAIPVPDDQLPVELPRLNDVEWKNRKGNPLEHAQEWVNTICPKCQSPARRETDTMDTFVDSSWYYLNFARKYAKKNDDKSSMPVDLYIGGVEHAILHLLYARFIAKVLSQHSSEIIPGNEPFSKLITQGMVHARTVSDPATGQFLKSEAIEWTDSQRPKVIATGLAANVSYEKMSKSKHNGVDPSEFMRQYGADITRAHLLFQAPVGDVLEWDESKIAGIQRWFGRIWFLTHKIAKNPPLDEHLPGLSASSLIDSLEDQDAELWKSVQITITSVDQSLSKTYALNTVISDLMMLTNNIHKYLLANQNESRHSAAVVFYHSMNILLRLLTPVAPSFAEECWAILHDISTDNEVDFDAETTASKIGFPECDGSLEKLQNRSQPCAIQVNGKLKIVIQIPVPSPGMQGEDLKAWIIENITKSNDAATEIQKGRIPIDKAKKIIVARTGRTVNFVLGKG